MRVTPLAVWCQNLTKNSVQNAVHEDVTITHPQLLVDQAIISYCLSIKYLINNPDEENRAQAAFDVAHNFSKESWVMRELQEWLVKAKCLAGWEGKRNKKGFIELTQYNPQE